jgi:hypothetical protein
MQRRRILREALFLPTLPKLDTSGDRYHGSDSMSQRAFGWSTQKKGYEHHEWVDASRFIRTRFRSFYRLTSVMMENSMCYAR